MRSGRLRSVLLSAVLVSLPSSVLAQGVGCAAILDGGAFDLTTTTSDTEVASATANWYSSAAQKLSGSGTTVGATYGVFGLKGSQTSEESISQSAAAYQSGDNTQVAKLAAFARTASPVIADAWRDCMGAFGLHVSSKTTSDPNEFYLIFRFTSSNPSVHPSTKLIAVTPGSAALTCTPLPPGGVSVSTAPYPVHCRRTSNTAVSVSYFASDANPLRSDPLFDFPAVKPIIPVGTLAQRACNPKAGAWFMSPSQRLSEATVDSGTDVRFEVAVLDACFAEIKDIALSYACKLSAAQWDGGGAGPSWTSIGNAVPTAVGFNAFVAFGWKAPVAVAGKECQLRSVVNYGGPTVSNYLTFRLR